MAEVVHGPAVEAELEVGPGAEYRSEIGAGLVPVAAAGKPEQPVTDTDNTAEHAVVDKGRIQDTAGNIVDTVVAAADTSVHE